LIAAEWAVIAVLACAAVAVDTDQTGPLRLRGAQGHAYVVRPHRTVQAVRAVICQFRGVWFAIDRYDDHHPAAYLFLRLPLVVASLGQRGGEVIGRRQMLVRGCSPCEDGAAFRHSLVDSAIDVAPVLNRDQWSDVGGLVEGIAHFQRSRCIT